MTIDNKGRYRPQSQSQDFTSNELLTLAYLSDVGSPVSGVRLIQVSEGKIKEGSAHFLLKKLHERGLLTLSRTAKNPNGSGGEILYSPTDLGKKIGALYKGFHKQLIQTLEWGA